MAEMQPVGLGIIPPNPQQGLGMMSSILGIQQQRQALQTGQYTQQKEQAGAQGEQQAMQERQLLQQTMKSGVRPDTGKSIYNENNEIDDNQLTDFANKNLPLTGQGVIQNIVKTQSDKTQLASAVADLGDKYNNDLSGRIRSFVNDPGANAESVNASLFAYAQQNPKAAPAVLAAGQLVKHIDGIQDMKTKNAALIHLSQMFQPAATTEVSQRPSIGTYQGAKGIQPLQTNPLASGGVQNSGPPLGPQGVAPQIVTFPNQQLGIMGGGAGGGSGGGSSQDGPQRGGISAPRTAAQDAPPPNAPGAVQTAYAQAVQQSNAHVEQIRQADNPLDYGNNMQIADQIRKLSKSTDTGPGTDTWHHVLGALGAPVGANNVADYQLLGAYLDRQAAGIRGAMGLPATNEGGVQSREIAGNTGYQGKALQDKNDLTQALTEGLHQYREGLDRVAGFSGQASPKAVNEFKSAWTKNFDPNVYKAELAYKRGPEEAKAFIKTLSPQEAASLTAKRIALKALSSGQVP